MEARGAAPAEAPRVARAPVAREPARVPVERRREAAARAAPPPVGAVVVAGRAAPTSTPAPSSATSTSSAALAPRLLRQTPPPRTWSSTAARSARAATSGLLRVARGVLDLHRAVDGRPRWRRPDRCTVRRSSHGQPGPRSGSGPGSGHRSRWTCDRWRCSGGAGGHRAGDSVQRAVDLRAHYSDAGVLPGRHSSSSSRGTGRSPSTWRAGRRDTRPPCSRCTRSVRCACWWGSGRGWPPRRAGSSAARCTPGTPWSSRGETIYCGRSSSGRCFCRSVPAPRWTRSPSIGASPLGGRRFR